LPLTFGPIMRTWWQQPLYKPEHLLTALKAYSSRSLNQLAIDGPDSPQVGAPWKHTYLWTSEEISAAIPYVIFEQEGDAMAAFEMPAAR
jgi:hypothetical protein